MNQEKILVTSSDNIPFSEIEQQFGVVDSQIVVGANIFRDTFAGIRDIFGGETKGYKKDIDKMKAAALSNVKAQAKQKGANAIIALKIDLDELSGGNKSMFMMNIYGSAVKLTRSAFDQDTMEATLNEFSIDDIEYFRNRRKIKEIRDSTDNVVNKVSMNKLSKYDLWNEKAASDALLNHQETYNGFELLKENISEIPIRYIEDFIKGNIHTLRLVYWDFLFEHLNERNWYNYDVILPLLKDENHIKRFRGLSLCLIKKDLYEQSDIKELEKLAKYILEDFDTTATSREKSKMIGSTEVYKCPRCLNETKLSKETCTNNDCIDKRINKFGLKVSSKRSDPKAIGQYLIDTSEAIKSAVNQIGNK